MNEPSVADVEQRAETDQRRAQVAEQLRALPVEFREALVLRYYLDLSEAQIASAMGISRGAVKSHTARGKAARTQVPRDTHYVRQLRDWKFSIEIESLRADGLQLYGELCGWTLARAHARSGDRIAIAAYLGGSDVFDRAIARFAAAYADQNERDYQALADAVKAGRITAEHGL